MMYYLQDIGCSNFVAISSRYILELKIIPQTGVGRLGIYDNSAIASRYKKPLAGPGGV